MAQLEISATLFSLEKQHAHQLSGESGIQGQWKQDSQANLIQELSQPIPKILIMHWVEVRASS